MSVFEYVFVAFVLFVCFFLKNNVSVQSSVEKRVCGRGVFLLHGSLVLT